MSCSVLFVVLCDKCKGWKIAITLNYSFTFISFHINLMVFFVIREQMSSFHVDEFSPVILTVCLLFCGVVRETHCYIISCFLLKVKLSPKIVRLYWCKSKIFLYQLFQSHERNFVLKKRVNSSMVIRYLIFQLFKAKFL